MALKLGATTLTALYLGSTAIATAYLGSTEVYTTGGAFSPLSLFSSGEEGAWYEPSQTTAFLSTTDLTPCDYGDACGFLLDKSQGAGYSGGSFTGLGTELVINGDFTTDTTGWSPLASSLSVSSQRLLITTTDPAGYGSATASFSTEVGKTYIVSWEMFNGTSTPGFRVGSTYLGFDYINIGGAGSYERTFVATGTTAYFRLFVSSATNGLTALFDSISVKELPGNHATQTAPDARPTLARVPEGGRRNLLEYTEDFTNAVWDVGGFTKTSYTETDPDGGNTALLITENNTSSNAYFRYTADVSDGTSQTFSVWLKATSEVSGVNLSTTGQVSNSTITITTSWQRFTVTASTNFSNGPYVGGFATITQGSGVGIYVWHPQLEPGSSATAYQKVVDEYDITEAGVTSLDYLSFDGSDDVLVVPTPSFSLQALDAFIGVEQEASTADSGLLTFAPASGNDYNQVDAVATSCAGTSHIFQLVGSPGITLRAEIAGSGATPLGVYEAHIDGTTATVLQDGANQATDSSYTTLNSTHSGNLLIGARFIGAITLRLEGKIFGSVIRSGAVMSSDENSNTRAYLATRSGVTL